MQELKEDKEVLVKQLRPQMAFVTFKWSYGADHAEKCLQELLNADEVEMHEDPGKHE